ncbi:MAG: alpha/beta fold hydrolase [Bacteroidia bacterium]|nr:alpha/beta fold hydrolase [Bacteroidia bacterium]
MRFFLAVILLLLAQSLSAQIVQINRYLPFQTSLPSDSGATFQLFLEEKVDSFLLDTSNTMEGKVVLLLHDGASPSSPLFDLAYQDYSWMNYLAFRSLDVFSVDFAGFGNSSRPSPMADPCNLSPVDQNFVGQTGCGPSPYPWLVQYADQESKELDLVVDKIRNLRNVSRVSLIGFGEGAERALTYAAGIGASKVNKIIALGANDASVVSSPPPALPLTGQPLEILRSSDFSNYFNSGGCAAAVAANMDSVVWQAHLATDPLASGWGPGVVRFPGAYQWGYTQDTVGKVQRPVLLVQGDADPKIPQNAIDHLFGQLVACTNKVSLHVRAGSHYLMYENRHQLLFQLSHEWLTQSSISGISFGKMVIKLNGDVHSQGISNDSIAPHTIETIPHHNAYNVMVNTDLYLRFNEYVTLSSAPRKLLLKKASNNAVVQSFVLNNSPEVTQICGNLFKVDIQQLDQATTYYVDVEGGAFFDDNQNLSNPIDGISKWVFSTTFVTDLAEDLSPGHWKIYPNPSHGRVSLMAPSSWHGEALQLSLYNLQGQQVWAQNSRNLELEMPTLPAGVYVLEVGSEAGKERLGLLVE